VSLLFAMMTLVVLSLAAVALVRSVDLGALILGNLGFKQDATAVSGVATAEAIAALNARLLAGTADADDAAAGYYASSLENLDPTGGSTTAGNKLIIVDWLGDGTCAYAAAGSFSACLQAKLGTSVNGNTVRWVITRLCKQTGVIAATNPCSAPVVASSVGSSNMGVLVAGKRFTATAASPYYRVVVRTQGARNTVSFTEAIVHF
jgi:hypothetical protein